MISFPGKTNFNLALKHCASIHLWSAVGFGCQVQKLESFIPPETQFNWGLSWAISGLVNTLIPHRRWMQGTCFADLSMKFSGIK
jgi:hypothetical protein